MLVMLMREAREWETSANVPMMATGTVTSGMSVARQFCRNKKTTKITSDDGDDQRLDHIS